MTFKEKEGGVSFSVILTPRASKATISGIYEGTLRIKVSSPPVDNKANIECVELLADIFSVAKSNVKILQGHKSRRKTIQVHGLTPQRAEQIIHEHVI